MEAVEKIIVNKTRRLNIMMRINSVDTIGLGNVRLGMYRNDLKAIEAILMEVCLDIENLVIDHSFTMDQTRKVNWTSQVSIIENSFMDYSKDINSKVAQLIQCMPAPAADETNGGAFIREKNEILRRQTEAQEKALQASIKDKSEKLNETTRVAEEKK